MILIMKICFYMLYLLFNAEYLFKPLIDLALWTFANIVQCAHCVVGVVLWTWACVCGEDGDEGRGRGGGSGAGDDEEAGGSAAAGEEDDAGEEEEPVRGAQSLAWLRVRRSLLICCCSTFYKPFGPPAGAVGGGAEAGGVPRVTQRLLADGVHSRTGQLCRRVHSYADRHPVPQPPQGGVGLIPTPVPIQLQSPLPPPAIPPIPADPQPPSPPRPSSTSTLTIRADPTTPLPTPTQLRFDAHYLMVCCRRPVPEASANIGIWLPLLELLSVLCIATNTALW